MAFRKRSAFQQWLDLPDDSSAAVPPRTNTGLPILVVGAGPAGLAAMSALKRAGVAFVGVESHSRVGGIWDHTNPLSSIYEGMRTVTSRFTTHLGRPAPGDWPDFVPHCAAHRYLIDFAEQEGLLSHIEFDTRFVDATKTARGAWRAKLAVKGRPEPRVREFRGIVVATGSHNRNHRSFPRCLRDQAVDSGLEVMHSADYQEAAPFAGKRVLVVGVGNSGTDIADKVSTVAQRTILSVRTPPWINPATILGVPCDKMAVDSTRLPHWYQMGAFHIIRRWAIGPLRRLGLSTPKHGLLDRVPVTDRGIVRAIRERRVLVRPHVTSIKRGIARFEKLSQPDEPLDAVIFATGFARQYPLLPPLDADGRVLEEQLTCFIFHRTEPALAFMTEVVGTWSCWPIFVEQARTIAAYFAAEECGAANVRRFHKRRGLPSPNFKGPLFAGANHYHIDYAIYIRALRELAAWLAE